jgi:hypothetical protein
MGIQELGEDQGGLRALDTRHWHLIYRCAEPGRKHNKLGIDGKAALGIVARSSDVLTKTIGQHVGAMRADAASRDDLSAGAVRFPHVSGVTDGKSEVKF